MARKPVKKTRKNAKKKSRKPAKPKTENESQSGVVTTQGQVASAFDVSVRAVQQWAANGMPGRRGEYNLLDIKAWKIAREQKNGKKNEGNADDPQQLEFWDVRYRKSRAELYELQLAEKQGKLVNREEVESALRNRIVAVKTNLLSLPKRLAPQLVALEIPEIESILDDSIRTIIEDFARGKL